MIPLSKMTITSYICGRTALALAILLALQLTGFSCLSEWEIGSALAGNVENSFTIEAPPAALEAPDGCPCHFYFSPVEIVVPEPVFPLNETQAPPPIQYALRFSNLPFRPPLRS